MQAISKTAERVGFEGVIPFAALLIMLSNVGAAGAYLAAGARLPFVAGIDRFLPPAFGALHPRWKTPWVGLLTQFVFGALFIFLGQAGTSIKGAYDVLVSMGVITYFIPFLYLFAAMFKLQKEPAGPGRDPRPRREAGGQIGRDRRLRDHDFHDRTVADPAAGRTQQAAGGDQNCRTVGVAGADRRLDLLGRKKAGTSEPCSAGVSGPAVGRARQFCCAQTCRASLPDGRDPSLRSIKPASPSSSPD